MEVRDQKAKKQSITQKERAGAGRGRRRPTGDIKHTRDFKRHIVANGKKYMDNISKGPKVDLLSNRYNII